MAAAQVYTAEALGTLAKIMRSSDGDAARVAACKEILDRGHGKPKQTIDATVEDRRMVEAPQPAKDAGEWISAHGPH